MWDSQERVNEDSSRPAEEAMKGKIHTQGHSILSKSNQSGSFHMFSYQELKLKDISKKDVIIIIQCETFQVLLIRLHKTISYQVQIS